MVKNLPSTDKTDQECPYISRQEWEDRGNSFGKADMRLVEIESEFYKYSENKKREIVKAFEAAISDIIAQLQIRTGFLLQDDLPSGLGKQYTMFEKTFANPQAWRLAQRPVVASAFGCKGWLEFDPSWMQPIDDTDTESLGRTIAAIQVYHDVHTAVYRFGPHFNGVWGCETCFDMQKSMTCKVKDLEIGSNKGCLYCQFLFGTLFDSIDTWKRPGKYYGDNGSIFQNHYDILELKLDWNGNVYPPRVVLSYGVSKVDDNDDEDEDSDEDAMISVDFTYKFWKYHEICVVMPWRRPSLHGFLNFLPPSLYNAADSLEQGILPQICSWLNTCNGIHSQCKSTATGLAAPRRLINLAAGLKRARLIETENGTSYKYIALSHSWGTQLGKAPPLQATLKTVDQLRERIPWAKLSHIFKHALILTRCLGLEFLWIDSICIVQDDDLDWRDQASKMANIYEGAYLTVSATKSHSGDEGFLSRPPIGIAHSLGDGIVLRTAHIEHAPWIAYSSLVADNESESHGNVVKSLTDPKFDQFPLLKRAWCFQERMLSTRVLHFGPDEITWECRSTTDCQCGDIRRAGKQSVKAAYHRSTSMQELWKFIVRTYTMANITRPTDLLPALAGIAKSLERQGGRYIAGLWEADLLSQLPWRKSIWAKDVPEGKRTPEYTAPTFSWASRIGPVEFIDFKPSKAAIDICDFRCTPEDTRFEYGRLKGGFLRVQGHLVRAYKENEVPLVYQSRSSAERSYRRVFIPFTGRTPSIPLPVGSSGFFHSISYNVDVPSDPEPKELWLLPLDEEPFVPNQSQESTGTGSTHELASEENSSLPLQTDDVRPLIPRPSGSQEPVVDGQDASGRPWKESGKDMSLINTTTGNDPNTSRTEGIYLKCYSTVALVLEKVEEGIFKRVGIFAASHSIGNEPYLGFFDPEQEGSSICII